MISSLDFVVGVDLLHLPRCPAGLAFSAKPPHTRYAARAPPPSAPLQTALNRIGRHGASLQCTGAEHPGQANRNNTSVKVRVQACLVLKVGLMRRDDGL